MFLYRVSLKCKSSWDKRRYSLYVVRNSKEEAIEYVNKYKYDDYEITKVSYLAHELSGSLFMSDVLR